MKPTMRLRWMSCDAKDAEKHGAFFMHRITGKHTEARTFFNLQQYWQDEDGDGNWRDIEVKP